MQTSVPLITEVITKYSYRTKTLHLLCISPSLIVFQLFGEQLRAQPQRRTGWDPSPAPTACTVFSSRPPLTPERSSPLTSTGLPHFSPQSFPLRQHCWQQLGLLGMPRPPLTTLTYRTSLEHTDPLSLFPWNMSSLERDKLFVKYMWVQSLAGAPGGFHTANNTRVISSITQQSFLWK